MNPEIANRIIKAVESDQNEIIHFLSRLVQIDSETGNEGKIQEFIAATLTEVGLETDQWEVDLQKLAKLPGYLPVNDNDFHGRPNVAGILRGTGGGKSLLLNGHVDTITPEPEYEWKFSPFSGRVIEGKVYGRGASDMKSGLAAMTMAVKILKDMGLKLKGDLILEYVVDEEVTGYGTLSAIERGYHADAGICCETSDLAVQPACIGRLWFTVEVRGKSSSISNRWESVSAIEKGMKIVQAVEDLEKIRIADLKHPLYPDNRGALPCAVCMFNAGTFPSATPDRAVLKGSMGLLPDEDVKTVKDNFVKHVHHLCQTDPWLRNNPPAITFKDLGADGAEIPANSPIVTAMKHAFQAVTGTEPAVSGRRGGSDTRYLIKYGHTPTVIFGPGTTDQMHATNEFVPVANLMIATKALALAIYDWCSC